MRKTIEIGRKKEKMGRMKGKRDEAWHRERVAVFMGQRQKSSETCKTTQIKGNEHKSGLKNPAFHSPKELFLCQLSMGKCRFKKSKLEFPRKNYYIVVLMPSNDYNVVELQREIA